MFNRNFINRIVSSNVIKNENISTLIMCLPENKRENALAILTGDATLHYTDPNMVAVEMDEKKEFVKFGDITPDYLEGKIRVCVYYKYEDNNWYQSPELTGDYRNYKQESGGYIYPKSTMKETADHKTFSLEDWNNGVICFSKGLF